MSPPPFVAAPASPEAAGVPGFTVEVITLVPQLWPRMLAADTGLVGRAFAGGQVSLHVRDLRDFGKGPHRQVDDSPFGGGAGMVLAVEPLHRAIEAARARTPGPVILLTPRGKRFAQSDAQLLAAGPGMTLICGRYEGMDERVRAYVDVELSLGDFVLSAGDPAAFAMVDATVRLRAGVLGNPASLLEESFAAGNLEYPQYTRPAIYAGQAVPAVLRGGNHAAVARWRQTQAAAATAARQV
jgi:tRNA (guanine37-N1)-methyltransferase